MTIDILGAANRKTNEIQVGVFTNRFTWTPDGDLASLSDGKGNTTTWKYDTEGRLTEKWCNRQCTAKLHLSRTVRKWSREVHHWHSNAPHIREIRGRKQTADFTDSTDSTDSHRCSSGSWGYHNFYHADGNGNVTALVNSSGTLQASYTYDPYGRYLTGTGTFLTANVMRFSSKPWVAFSSSSATSRLYYYGCRFYDPYLQRWPNTDPIGEVEGVNLYGIVLNNPVGLRIWRCIIFLTTTAEMYYTTQVAMREPCNAT